MTTVSLSAVFRAACVRDARHRPEESDALERTLRDYVVAARAAWPQLAFEASDLIEYVARRSSGGTVPPAIYAGDVLLAFACVRGLADAVNVFATAFRGVIRRVMARRGVEQADTDDVSQSVFERLLVGTPAGSAPKIAEYRGNGPLRSWVSTTAATTLAMMRRSAARRREQPDDGTDQIALHQADPELRYLKERYKVEIEAAVVRALARLDDRQRTLLKMQLGERVSIDRLGAMYGVNRATAARWLVAAREALVSGARDEIRAELHLTETEYDSLTALVRSDLHVSIARHL